MQRKDILIHAWDFTYDIEGWYPPLKAALKDVDFQQANWRPEGKASHTIAELVNHLLYYKRRFLFRLEKKSWASQAGTNDETFLSNDSTAETWASDLEELRKIHQQIKTALVGLEDNDLDVPLPETPVGGQVVSLVMHDAYHTGQIILIRKLYGSWPVS
jgi:uncharacterized damage-inducible protein DinB